MTKRGKPKDKKTIDCIMDCGGAAKITTQIRTDGCLCVIGTCTSEGLPQGSDNVAWHGPQPHLTLLG